MADKKKYSWKEFEAHCQMIEQATSVRPNEPFAEKMQRIKLLLKNYNEFCKYYFPHYCADEITGELIDCGQFQIDYGNEILKNPNFFGVLEWAREHAKSVHACVFAPVWLWVHKELDGFLLCGKDEDAAIKLLADVQAEFESNERLKNDFGEQKRLGSWTEGDFSLRDGTFFTAIGRGQSPRGIRKRQRRPNAGAIDDIDDDEIVLNQKRVRKVVKWILGAYYPALSTKRSRVTVCGNRIHKQSILAHLVGDITPDTPKRKNIWHSKVCAWDAKGNVSWHQKYTREQLDAKMSIMGTLMARREYFHEPVIEGTVFKENWIQWGPVPKLREMDALIVYGDPSFSGSATSDFKAIVFIGQKGKMLYIIKSYCRQATVTKMVRWWYDFAAGLPDSVTVTHYMEALFSQNRLLEDFEKEGIERGWQLPVIGDKRAKPDKFSRITANLQPLFERGLVIVNEAERGNPDMQEGISQLIAIEPGTATPDDWPDALEGAAFKLRQQTKQNSFQAFGGYKEYRSNY